MQKIESTVPTVFIIAMKSMCEITQFQTQLLFNDCIRIELQCCYYVYVTYAMYVCRHVGSDACFINTTN